MLAVSLCNVNIVNGQTFQIEAPWDSGQYWVPQTYDLHWGGTYGGSWDEARRAVDFYWADPQELGVFGRAPEVGRGKNVRAAHSGIAQIRRLNFNGDCDSVVEQSNVIVSDDSQQLKTEYIHLEPNSGIQIGDSIVINIKCLIIELTSMRQYSWLEYLTSRFFVLTILRRLIIRELVVI